MEIKVSDYIVNFFAERGVTDVFGYPGGMVTHLMESFSHRKDIHAHVNYHEQAAAFCACGYAQISGIPGVAYATSGPGATNLITGICDAYFDSIPTVFITGQVNTFEGKGQMRVRQKGFQETDIVSMISPVTKYAVYVSEPGQIRFVLEKAWYLANSGRKGPVLLDIPMNIQRSIVNSDVLEGFHLPVSAPNSVQWDEIKAKCEKSRRPLFLLGAGVKNGGSYHQVEDFIDKYQIPTVTSMPAFDLLSYENKYNYGFIGAYGSRVANFIAAKSDLIIALGTRLDVRQIGAKRENFAPNAELIRVEVDEGELENTVKENELQINMDAFRFMDEFKKHEMVFHQVGEWKMVCDTIRKSLSGRDELFPGALLREISRKIENNTIITTDVGQNQVWIAQSFEVKKGQRVLFSSGHGAMGYSLPAAIGAYYAGHMPVVSINGDGGIQMNIQELQYIAREKLPITIVIMNNHALGMIRHFQEMYFKDNYYQTVPSGGYTVPDFGKIADAYGLNYYKVEKAEDIDQIDWKNNLSQIVDVVLDGKTYVFPKLEFGKPNQDQEPLLERELYQELMEL